jgi:hypothetical protein
MADQRDQQAASAHQQAPYPPSTHPGAPEAPYAAPPAAPVRAGVVERLTRLILRRVAYGLILAGRVIRPRLGWVLLTLFLAGIIGLETIALIAPLFIGRMADNRPPAIPLSADVESFLQGQALYDADMMWDAFSPGFQTFLMEQGVSKDDLAMQAESERTDGQKYKKFSYVGGINLQDDQRMYFYAVDIESPQANRNGTFSFVFTVDGDGKIVGLRM